MGGRMTFSFQEGTSWLHRWDARCKLAALVGVALLLAGLEVRELLAGSVLLLTAVVGAGLTLRPLAAGLRPLLVMAGFLFLMQCLLAPRGGGPLDPATLAAAALVCWRLLLVAALGLVFTATTSTRQMQAGAWWYLHWVPFLPAGRLAHVAALAMRFVPLTYERAGELRMAWRARLGDRPRRLRPAARLLPLLRRSLLQAGELAQALEARGHRTSRPPRPRRASPVEVLALGAVLAVAGALDLLL